MSLKGNTLRENLYKWYVSALKKTKTAPLLDIKSVVLSGMFSVALLTVYLLHLSVGGHAPTSSHTLAHIHTGTQARTEH